MATTYMSSQAGAGVPPKAVHAGAIGRSATYALAAALALDDVVQMFKLPAGANVLDVVLAADDLDTNASPAIKLDVGDATVQDRFIKQSTVAQGGGVARMDQPGGAGHKYAADTMLQVKVQTAPATGASSGNLRLSVLYSMDA